MAVKKPVRKASGSLGTYKGPKPRAYSSLSKADKAKEDAQNERDMKPKAKRPGKSFDIMGGRHYGTKKNFEPVTSKPKKKP